MLLIAETQAAPRLPTQTVSAQAIRSWGCLGHQALKPAGLADLHKLFNSVVLSPGLSVPLEVSAML